MRASDVCLNCGAAITGRFCAACGERVVPLYSLAFRRVFGGTSVATIAKSAAIGVIYLLTSLPAFFVILFWAALS